METDSIALLRSHLMLTVQTLDGCRMRLQLLELLTLNLLTELPPGAARRTTQRTADQFRMARAAAKEERHPAAEAEALQQLNALLQAGDAAG